LLVLALFGTGGDQQGHQPPVVVDQQVVPAPVRTPSASFDLATQEGDQRGETFLSVDLGVHQVGAARTASRTDAESVAGLGMVAIRTRELALGQAIEPPSLIAGPLALRDDTRPQVVDECPYAGLLADIASPVEDEGDESDRSVALRESHHPGRDPGSGVP